jgi:hypothetical protein
MAHPVVALGALVLSAVLPRGAPSANPALTGVPAVTAAERLPLPPFHGPATLMVDPLRARIELRVTDAVRIAAQLRPMLGALCPIAETAPGVVVLRCRTRRLDAQLTNEGGRSFLDIRALRGLPFRGPEQQLAPFYDPARLATGDGCPGSTPASRGECALADGRPNEAALQFHLALGTTQHAWAAVRLGDLAFKAGDVSGALQLYQKAGTSGPFARLALLRACEITGACLSEPGSMAFSTVTSPEPLATEVTLRAARADTFEGRVGPALGRIAAVLGAKTSQPFCDEIGLLFCRRLVVDLLERSDAQTGRKAIEVYLTLPRRLEGPMVLELATAAAERSAALGAPVFGGNIMTSVFSAVDPEGMRGYLLRTAELYAQGHDDARAHLVLEYAESRFVDRQISDARWVALRARLKSGEGAGRRLTPDEAHRFEDLVGLVTEDLTAARATMERAQALTR